MSWFGKKNNTSQENTSLLEELKVSVNYLLNKHKISDIQFEKSDDAKCGGCHNSLAAGSYFSCFLCIGKVSNSCYLCSNCYNGGKFEHQHPLTYFFDHHELLNLFKERIQINKNLAKQKEMDDLCEIAKSYYRAGSPQTEELLEFFKSLDTDGDKQIDLSELLDYMRREGYTQMRNPHFFRQLDRDNSGSLEINEVMTLYYIIKSGRPFCDYCGNFVAGIYFSCIECFKNPKNPFNLCRDCYQSLKHNHSHGGQQAQFMDNYMLLEAKKDSILLQEKGVNPKEKEMAELCEVAKSYFQVGCSTDEQALAQEFFKSMDVDGDGSVNRHEFLEFMRQEGHTLMCNRHFFEELDRDNDEALDFWEVMTLYYVIKSGRPFCDCCGNFVPGLFYSCFECFTKNPNIPFNLCRDCYVSGKFLHSHNGKSQFLDNFALLEAERDKSTTLQRVTEVGQNIKAKHVTVPSNNNVSLTVHNTKYVENPPTPNQDPVSSNEVAPQETSKLDISVAAMSLASKSMNFAMEMQETLTDL